ncbi:MAG: PP2C family protein-serine/threonine phosphatase [Chitinophagaceae bacterium]
MEVKSFALNEIGGRQNLEDAIAPPKNSASKPHAKTFVVCDGVGGSNFGEVAAEFASSIFYQQLLNATIDSQERFTELLKKALSQFQKKLNLFTDENTKATGASSTLVLIHFVNNTAYLAWCGDSKIFQIRSGKAIYKTADHSLVHEMVAKGIITEEEAEKHPQRNIITRSINAATKPTDIQVKLINDIQADDWFLLCTDGLMEQFHQTHFQSILYPFQNAKDYTNIINNICFGKTKDNYSMYLIHVNSVKKKNKSALIFFALLAVIAVIVFLGYWFSSQSAEHIMEKNPPKNDTAVESIMLKVPPPHKTVDTVSPQKTANK